MKNSNAIVCVLNNFHKQSGTINFRRATKNKTNFMTYFILFHFHIFLLYFHCAFRKFIYCWLAGLERVFISEIDCFLIVFIMFAFIPSIFVVKYLWNARCLLAANFGPFFFTSYSMFIGRMMIEMDDSEKLMVFPIDKRK